VTSKQPDIVFSSRDNLGWGEAGCHGAEERPQLVDLHRLLGHRRRHRRGYHQRRPGPAGQGSPKAPQIKEEP
jgi:hypothetical protein